jgi:hypothetical protein
MVPLLHLTIVSTTLRSGTHGSSLANSAVTHNPETERLLHLT